MKHAYCIYVSSCRLVLLSHPLYSQHVPVQFVNPSVPSVLFRTEVSVKATTVPEPCRHM